MKTKKLIIVFFLMISAFVASAQENKSGKKGNEPMGMGMKDNVESCMDQIAADKSLRMQMMTKMMDTMKNDTTAMRQMCEKMMKDPQMHGMMMKMMNHGGMGSGSQTDRTMNHDMHMKSDSLSIQQP